MEHFTLTACDGPAPSRTAVDRWFANEFWPLYPRKIGRDDALKWCRKHANSIAARIAIRKGAEVWSIEFREREVQYVPYPATWLRRGDWREESWPAEKAHKMSALERMIAGA